MIKARRKSKTTTDTKKNNAAARATGRNKASRAANLAARRGLAVTKKANAMEVEKQVQRQAGRAGAAGQGGRKTTATGKGGGRGRGGGGGGGGGRPGGPKLADVKSKVRAKGRALAGVAKTKQQPKSTPAAAAITAPSQQAIGAAAKAMKSAGFKPPKGMQMQISFVPKQQPQQQQQKQGGGRGGGRGGGGGNGGSRGGGRGRGRGGRR